MSMIDWLRTASARAITPASRTRTASADQPRLARRSPRGRSLTKRFTRRIRRRPAIGPCSVALAVLVGEEPLELGADLLGAGHLARAAEQVGALTRGGEGVVLLFQGRHDRGVLRRPADLLVDLGAVGLSGLG